MRYNILGCDEMNIFVLASGSGGNATYVEIGQKKLLIDAGLSLRQIVSRLSMVGITLSEIDYVFLTHEHGDHLSGLVTIQKKHKSLVYLTEGTYKNMPLRIRDNLDTQLIRILTYNESLLLDGFSVKTFMTYHDALEPCGYRFTEGGNSMVYMTDTGYFPQAGFDLIRNADLYIIEANHSPDLLLDSDRPWLLKKRILDDQGHLSNEDSAFLIANVMGEKTKKIVLAHLSEECNTETDALDTYKKVFFKQGISVKDYDLICAKQDYPIEEIKI